MRKSIIVPVITVLLIIAGIIFLKDGWIYLMSSLMAVIVMGIIRGGSTHVTKVARWGKANPHKAQALITFLQLAIASLGIIVGYNFKKLGYELSDSTAVVFSSLIIVCFLCVPFLPKRNVIAIPKQVNKHRLAFMGIALSSFIIMIVFGNRIEGVYPNSFIANSLERFDQTIFPHDDRTLYTLDNVASASHFNDNVQSDESTNRVVFASFPVPDNEKVLDKKDKKLEKKELRATKRLQKFRLALAAGMSASAILLLILLVPVLCAGICLIIGGISGELAAAYIFLGALITGGTIWGMIKLIQGPRENR